MPLATKRTRITITSVQRMMPGETLYDADVHGFGARRQSESISYFVKTRIKGRQKWVTIGKHGSPWMPDTARKEARRILTEADDGIDRTELKRRETTASTFAQVAARFVDVYGPKLKPRSLEEYQGLIDRYLIPAFGRLRIDAIVRADVTAAHAKWADRPRTANHALAVLSKIMSWAEEHGLRPERTNPCFKIKKYRETKRQRYLSTDELRRLGAAIVEAEAEGKVSYYAGAAIRLLVLTGARLNEILTLKWPYVDLERRILILPDSKTGEKTIALSAPAIELLTSLRRDEHNPYVIPGHRLGAPMVDLFKPWTTIRGKANLDDVRIHDLRHTFASFAVASGGSLPMIGKMLGHKEPQTTARYAHLSDDPVSRLTETTALQIAQAMAKPRDQAL